MQQRTNGLPRGQCPLHLADLDDWQRARGGDRAAVEVVVLAGWHAARAAAARYRLDAGGDADDLAQEAALDLLELLASPRTAPAASLDGFVFGRVRGLLSRLFRSRARRRACRLEVEPRDAAARRPLDELAAREEMAAIERAIERLPPNYRSALQRVIAGATPAEVASERGDRDSNLVRTWLFRARERLAAWQARSN